MTKMDIQEFTKILQEHQIRCGSGVPCSYFKPLVNQMLIEPDLDYIPATSEGEAVAIAAGLTAAGKPAFALMQNSGLGNAVNPVTSLLYIYQIPVALLVSHRGEPGKPDEPQHLLMGQITEELARLIDLRTEVLDPERFPGQLQAAQADGVPAAWICRKGTLTGGPKAPAFNLRISSGAVSPKNQGVFEPSMTREQALAVMAPDLNRGLSERTAPAVVCTTGTLSRELYELDDQEHDKANRFYMVGSMGCAAGFGLGIARGDSARQVVILDGDGAVLMKMGTLATIAKEAPKNLHHVILDNGAYDSTGAQATVSPGVDFAAVALACGYQLAETVSDRGALEQAFSRHLAHPGPTLLRVAIFSGARKELGRPKLTPREGWLRFCAYLQHQG